MNQYTHRYSLTAADMDTRYRMTPNAVLLYYQDCWARYMACLHLAAFDIVKQNRIWVITEFNAWFEEQTAFWSDDIDVSVWNSEVSALRLYAEFRAPNRLMCLPMLQEYNEQTSRLSE
jgi:acyl-CoA thioesterase FadM